MRLLVVVQARMGSSRLPGKVLLPVNDEPILIALLRRVRTTNVPFELCVATTTAQQDYPIVKLCADLGVRCYRGHPTDLLERHYKAALEVRAHAVAKIPSDCPLIDPAVVERVLWHYLENADHLDYVSNLHPATYPDGNDVEVMSMGALEVAHREAQRPFEREHTTPYIWERPERFRIGNISWETGLDYSMSHRFTLDYPEDYQFIKAVFEEFGASSKVFTLGDILKLLQERPDIAAANVKFAGVNWYRHHLSELRHVSAVETRALEQT